MSGAFISYGSFFALGIEGTHGTLASRTVGFAPLDCSASMDPEFNPAQDLYQGGNASMGPARLFAGRFNAAASVSTYLLYGGIGLLWRMALGQAATQANVPSAGRYTHTYTAVGTLPSASGELWLGTGRALSNLSRTIEGAKLNVLTISGEANQQCRIGAEFIAERVNVPAAAGTKPTAATGEVAQGHHGSTDGFSWAGTDYKLLTFGLTLNNGLTFRDEWGTAESGEPHMTNLRVCTMEIEREYTDSTFESLKIDTAEGVAAQPLILVLTRPGATVDTVTITLPSAAVTSQEVVQAGFGIIRERLTFTALDDGSGLISVVVVNAQTTSIVA